MFVLALPLATIGAVPFAERMAFAVPLRYVVAWVYFARRPMFIFNALMLWFPVAVGIVSIATFSMGNAA